MNSPQTNQGTAPSGVRPFSIELEREGFLLSIVRELSGVLQDTAGVSGAAGFVHCVGQRIGLDLLDRYRETSAEPIVDPEQTAQILVDLKDRIGGGFEVVAADEQVLRFTNCACPFGAAAEGRPSLCMMTSNVFGSITAQVHGYAAVELEQTIANGDPTCEVVVHLDPDQAPPNDGYGCREYFDDVG